MSTTQAARTVNERLAPLIGRSGDPVPDVTADNDGMAYLMTWLTDHHYGWELTRLRRPAGLCKAYVWTPGGLRNAAYADDGPTALAVAAAKALGVGERL